MLTNVVKDRKPQKSSGIWRLIVGLYLQEMYLNVIAETDDWGKQPKRQSKLSLCPDPDSLKLRKAMESGYEQIRNDNQAGCDLHMSIAALIMSTRYTDGRLTFMNVMDDAGDEVLCRLEQLFAIRRLEKLSREKQCGLLVYLFQAMLALIQLKHNILVSFYQRQCEYS
jgi:hypothetical protein